jgi:uncharacterized protein (TIGR02217 family)
MTSPIVLPDVIFTEDFMAAAGARGKNNRRNDRGEQLNGNMRVKVGWTRTRRDYEIATIPLPLEMWMQVEAAHEVTDSGAFGLLLEDPKDSTVITLSGPNQGLVAKLSAATFQLYQRRRFMATDRYRDRKITRPRAETVQAFVNDTPVEFTLDDTTGRATIPSDPDEEDVTWSGRFYVPAQFQDDFIDWDLVAPAPDQEARLFKGPTVLLREILE